MDMSSRLETIFGTALNYRKHPMSTAKGLLVRLILTVVHMMVLDILCEFDIG